MANNDQEILEGKVSGNVAESEVADTAPVYHAPKLTSYGALAELVQNNPGVGSDGGVGDCQHA